MTNSQGAGSSQVPTLDSRLATVLELLRLRPLFPLQHHCLQHVSSGSGERDLCVTAPTGSGKTLAYLLLLMHELSKKAAKHNTMAVVILPNLDLAIQVCKMANHFCCGIRVQVRVSAGKYTKQRRFRSMRSRTSQCGTAYFRRTSRDRRRLSILLKEKTETAQILVSTPGRLTMGQTRSLRDAQIIIVDEADKILYQSHQNWLETLNKEAHRRRTCFGRSTVGERTGSARLQFVLCSATLTKSNVHSFNIFAPKLINFHDDNRPELPEMLAEYVVASHTNKLQSLLSLLTLSRGRKIIIFCASSERAHLLIQQINGQNMMSCYEYSGIVPQQRRTEVLLHFQKCNEGVLIASDAATRGLDIQGVSLVISFDAPEYFQTYLHRAGRTARAGRTGKCVTLCSSTSQVRKLSSMLKRPHTVLTLDELGSIFA